MREPNRLHPYSYPLLMWANMFYSSVCAVDTWAIAGICFVMVKYSFLLDNFSKSRTLRTLFVFSVSLNHLKYAQFKWFIFSLALISHMILVHEHPINKIMILMSLTDDASEHIQSSRPSNTCCVFQSIFAA